MHLFNCVSFVSMEIKQLILIMICVGVIGTAGQNYAPAGCTYDQAQERATCDFARWNPPLQESNFGPGIVYQIDVNNVDGKLPREVPVIFMGTF